MPTSSACKELAALFVLMDGLIMMLLLRLAVFVMMLTAHVISMLVI